MTVDPRRARAALAKYVPSRILRHVKGVNATIGTCPIPGNIKQAHRQMSRFLKDPTFVVADAKKVGGQISCVLVRRGATTVNCFNEKGELYETEVVHYNFRATQFRKGRRVVERERYVTFLPHAIQRWAERGADLDLKAPDAVLLKRLDSEALLLTTVLEDMRYPMISTESEGLWLGKLTRIYGSEGVEGVTVDTFLPGETLTGNRRLYYEGGHFDDPNDLMRITTPTEEHLRLLRKRAAELGL